jgi:hypothetical protein
MRGSGGGGDGGDGGIPNDAQMVKPPDTTDWSEYQFNVLPAARKTCAGPTPLVL